MATIPNSTVTLSGSGPPLDALDRAQRLLRQMVNSQPSPDDRHHAEILEQGCKDDAELVRRLAGLTTAETTSAARGG